MTFFSRILLPSATALLLAISSQAYAQAVPSSAEASRVGGQIAPMSTTSSAAIGGKVSAGGALVAPKGAEKVKFTLKAVKVEGQTAALPSFQYDVEGGVLAAVTSLDPTAANVAEGAVFITRENEGTARLTVRFGGEVLATGQARFANMGKVTVNLTVDAGPNAAARRRSPARAGRPRRAWRNRCSRRRTCCPRNG